VGGSGRSVYSIEAIPREQRVRVLAFSRSALNIGFTVGVLAAGVVLTVNTRSAYHAMVLANAAGLLGSAACIARLPAVPRVQVDERPEGRLGVLQDRPFLAVTVLCGVLLSYGTLMTEVIPLWLITRTNAPRVLLAVLFAVNTVMVVALQVLATRGTETLAGSARVLRRCGLVAALACPVVYLSGVTPVPVTVALLVLALVLITAAELWQSAGAWGVSTELAPAGRRGAYLGVFRLGPAAQSMVGPAALTWLAIGTGGWGWLLISALFVVAALAAGPVVAWAGRTPREAPVPV
jgi:hypothetical protein